MIEFRMRTMIAEEELQQKIGKIVTESDYNALLTGPAKVLRPDGSLLAVYVPSALPLELLDASYATLHSLKRFITTNRGLASGTRRFDRYKGSSRSESKGVASAIVGAFDASGPRTYCRLTAWTGQETEQFSDLFPYFNAIADVFRQNVPERFATQMAHAYQTKPEWVVPGTPFTTITVNNTYPTGVHVDKGDLNEGFSCLSALRVGDYKGGVLTFPRYRLGVDMKHGDVLLMDAHEWHGNTAITCSHGNKLSSLDPCTVEGCNAERISTVCYFRTKMVNCGSLDEEQQKRVAAAERGIDDSDEALLKETVSRGA